MSLELGLIPKNPVFERSEERETILHRILFHTIDLVEGCASDLVIDLSIYLSTPELIVLFGVLPNP